MGFSGVKRKIKMRKNNGQFADGSKHLVTHGMSKSRIYGVWRGMINRCTNPNEPSYPNYGGRGIEVCQRWMEFPTFYADMGDCPNGHSLDRIDNSLGYSPDNCRWATRLQQARNRRGRVFLSVDGKTQTIAEWSEETGIGLQTIWARINKGWPEERAVKEPIRISKRWHNRHGVKWSEAQ